MASDILASSGSEIRENLVTTAVKFLSNPNVQRCTLESKERFLRNKGLTDREIQKAIEKCGELIDVPSIASDFMFFNSSRRSWLRERVLPIIVYGGFMYGCYWFYKNCVKHLIFVEEPKRKSTAECIEELRKSLDVLNSSVTSLRNEVQAAAQHNALRFQLDNLKSDIASVKGILLNRFGFFFRKVAVEEKKKSHRSRSQRSESGGSNSSEGEHATKNSDSSLEIIT
ncbi:Peroxisomal membrane protein PEX14 [Papilio xuthus]|uniref:Peroxisomal membrane protein PEX14 n=1 Tax=Papilio xuthus TaxID=66420 RepID=A0A194Q030_PAPXU|nr:Peroxisomal membrane protein PEX14 [Papilio xuthus]